MSTMFSLLAKIRKHPSMYLGGTDSNRLDQLRTLDTVLRGYGLAIETHQIADPGADLISNIADRLFNERHWSRACGGIEAIIQHTATGEEAWELFWDMAAEEGARLDIEMGK